MPSINPNCVGLLANQSIHSFTKTQSEIHIISDSQSVLVSNYSWLLGLVFHSMWNSTLCLPWDAPSDNSVGLSVFTYLLYGTLMEKEIKIINQELDFLYIGEANHQSREYSLLVTQCHIL
jgi:hypothetical protein